MGKFSRSAEQIVLQLTILHCTLKSFVTWGLYFMLVFNHSKKTKQDLPEVAKNIQKMNEGSQLL